jgi:hypothetical protein
MIKAFMDPLTAVAIVGIVAWVIATVIRNAP